MTTLTTVPNVKTQLNKSFSGDDSELLDYVNAVTAPIEFACGPVLQRTVTNELHRDVRGDTLVLKGERFVSITTLTSWAGTTGQVWTGITTPADSASYTFIADPDAGMLYRTSGVWCGELLTVTYEAGFATVPFNIDLAARMMVADWWETQQGGAGLPPVFEDDSVTIGGAPLPRGRRIYELLQPFFRAPAIA